MLSVTPEQIVAIVGYRGDRKVRVAMVAEVGDRSILVLDQERNQWRRYILSEIEEIREVRS